MNFNYKGREYTDRDIQILKDMLADKKSAGEVSRVLDRSRNSIISKARSLGVPMHHKFGGRQADISKAPRKPPVIQRIKKVTYKPLPKEPEVLEEFLSDATHVTFLELTRFKCHYPIGDPKDSNFCYCGGDVAHRHTKKPSWYCRFHEAIIYQPHDRKPNARKNKNRR